MHELNDAIASVNNLATTLPQTAYMQSYDRDVSAIQHLLFFDILHRCRSFIPACAPYV